MSIISAGTSNTSTLVYTGDTTGNLAFQINGTTEAMRITSGGSVGIGTSNPAFKLDMVGSSRFTGTTNSVYSKYTNTGSDFWVGIDNSAGTDFGTGTGYSRVVYSSGAYPLTFTTNDAERMRITSAGYVGIGTTNPTTQLYVTGAGSGTFGAYNDPLIVKGSSYTYLHLLGTNNQAGVIYNRNSSTGYFGGLDNNGGLKFVYMSTMNEAGVTNAKDSGTPSLLLTTGGDLVVGKTSTALATVGFGVASDGSTLITKTHADSGGAQLYLNRLNVNGPAVYFYKDTNNVGNISVTGSATSYNSGSDYRLKNNIEPLSNALQKVALLKPSKWIWKADDTYGDGFVAHELAEVCPNAVTGEKDAVDADGKIIPQSVDTSFLVATLTAAIQELKAELDATKAEVAALKGNN